MKDIMDLHTHTTASGHAYNTLYEMARSAADKGLTLFGSTDHAPAMPGTCDAFYFINFKVIPRTLFEVKLLMGSELNILDYEGTLDLKPRFLKGLDYAIASIHEPCYTNGSIDQNTSAYIGAVKNPYVTIIGHPDDSRFPFNQEAVVTAAAKYHKLIEVNSSSLHPKSTRQNARENYRSLLDLCRRYEVSIVINSDAHVEGDVGNHARAWELTRELAFPEELIVNSSIERILPYIPKLEEYL